MARHPVAADSPLLAFAKQANLPKAQRNKTEPNDGLLPFERTESLNKAKRNNVPPRPHPTPMERHIAKKSIINTATRGDEEKQRIATPWPFIHALEQRFGVPVDFDLAADEDNTKAPFLRYFTEKQDSLKCDWGAALGRGLGGDGPSKLAYLNPPYANIKPWALGPKDNPAAGLAACRWLTRWTVMLVPASYSTDWFLELRGKVQLDAIPRIMFEGATHLYPKDLVLCVAGFGVAGSGYWDWRASYVQYCAARSLAPEPNHLKGVTKLPLNVLPDFNWTPDPFAPRPR